MVQKRIGGMSRAEQNEPSSIFAPPLPILRNGLPLKPYGLKIIEFESWATPKLYRSMGEAQTKYLELFFGIFDDLHKLGLDSSPVSKENLLKSYYSIQKSINSAAAYSPNLLLSRAIAKNELDCDTRSYVLADALTNLGYDVYLIGLPKHALITAVLPDGDAIYLESTSPSHYEKLADVKDRWGREVDYIYKFEFSSKSPFVGRLYDLRERVKGSEKWGERDDFEGAFGADQSSITDFKDMLKELRAKK